jgi:Ca-activated chloride channel family protein
MTFLAPELLFGLLLIPVAIGFYLWTQRRRSRYAVRFTNLDLLANLTPRRPAWRRHVPPVLYLGAIAALLIGLARPTMVIPVPREDATILLAMDVSGSMRATDVDPSRLDAAKAAAISFIDQIPEGVRIGIVSFASEPNTLVSPTTDRAELVAAIDGLTARDGTAMGDALMQVLDIAERIQAEDADAPDATATPTPAATLGVPIYTIALGTPEGTVEVLNEFGEQVTLEVPPDTETLDRIAEITGGQSFDAPSATDLEAVYANLESRVGYTEEVQEVTFLLVAAGLVLVIVGAGASALWFGRLP